MTRTRPLLALGLALLAAAPLSAQEDAFSLQGLIVTASPTPLEEADVAATVTVVTRAELGALGDRSLGEALRDVAGITTVRGGSFGGATSLFVRGGESDYTLVMVDGVQVNQGGGGFDFSTLSTDNVERIEIVRGPSSALYGSDAVTGVVHIITRTGRGAPRGSLAARAGSFGTTELAAELTGGTERAGYALSLSTRSGDGILDFNNEHRTTAFSGRVRVLPDSRTEVDLSVRLTDHRFHFPTDGSGAVVDRNAFSFSDAAQLGVVAKRALGDRFTLEARLGVSENDGGTNDQPDSPADTVGFFGFTSLDDFRRTTGEIRGHLSLPLGTVTGGVEVERQRQRSFTESLSQFGPSSDRSESERDNRAAFVHASSSAGALTLSGGMRVEDNERFGGFHTWQAGVSWLVLPEQGTRFRASAGSALKEPTFFENFATGFATGNPDLDPERSRSWEVGLEQALLEERLTVRATWFDQRFRDLIQFTFAPPAPGDPNYFNVAAASASGVELDVEARFGRVSAGVVRSWLRTEVEDAGFDSGPGATFVEGESLLRRPESTWSARVGAQLRESGRLFARLAGVGERSDRDFATFPATPVVLQAYTTLSAGAEWTLAPSVGLPAIELTVVGENLLDESYQEVLGFRAPGRALYVGASVAVGGR